MANSQGYSPGVAADEILKPGTLPTKFTEEEIAVLKECNTESVMYRCFPLSALFMGVTHTLVKVGYLPPHPKYGPLFKNLAAVFIGYVVGKLSYQSVCREKILTKIPNSRLARALTGNVTPLTTETEFTGQETKDDTLLGQQPSYDLDTNRSSLETAKGLDDNFRPTVDREIREKRVDENQPSFAFKSYDELRYKNRMSYDKQPPQTQNERPLDNMQRRRPEPTPWPAREQATSTKKNQYGDEWDE